MQACAASTHPEPGGRAGMMRSQRSLGQALPAHDTDLFPLRPLQTSPELNQLTRVWPGQDPKSNSLISRETIFPVLGSHFHLAVFPSTPAAPTNSLLHLPRHTHHLLDDEIGWDCHLGKTHGDYLQRLKSRCSQAYLNILSKSLF